MKLMNDEYRRVRLLYWLHYIGGGIYVSEEFSTPAKWFWFTLNLCVVMLFMLGRIGFFMTIESLDWLDTIIVCLSECAVIYCCALIFPLVTIYYHRDIVNLLRFIEHAHRDATRRTWRNAGNELIDRFEKIYFRLIAVLFGMSVAILTVPAITLLFRSDALKSLGKLEHHLMGIPYGDRIFSLELYLGIYFVEVLFAAFFVMIACTEPLLIMTIASELNYIVAVCCEDMRALGEIFAHQYQIGKRSAMLSHRFDVKLSSFIRKHQNMMRSFQLIRPYFQIFSAFMVPTIFLFSASQIFIFMLTNFNNLSLKLRILTHTIFSQFYFYVHCVFGTLLDDMREDIVQEVYNLPWYYLSPSQRKKVYIFLNVVQRPVIFKALRVYPVNMTLFPNVLRLAYSYVSALYVYTKTTSLVRVQHSSPQKFSDKSKNTAYMVVLTSNYLLKM